MQKTYNCQNNLGGGEENKVERRILPDFKSFQNAM